MATEEPQAQVPPRQSSLPDPRVSRTMSFIHGGGAGSGFRRMSSFFSRSPFMAQKDRPNRPKSQEDPHKQQALRKPPPLPHSSMPLPPPSTSRSDSPPNAQKLQKREVASSDDLLKPRPAPSPRLSPQGSPSLTPTTSPRGRKNTLISEDRNGSPGRTVSGPVPAFWSLDGQSPDRGSSRMSKALSWMPGMRSRNTSADLGKHNGPRAWIGAGNSRIDYDHLSLVHGEKVDELWDDNNDTLVYLWPRATGTGPSFKIPSMVIASSQTLVAMTHGGKLYSQQNGRQSPTHRDRLSTEDALKKFSLHRPMSPPSTLSGSNASGSDGTGDSDNLDMPLPRESSLYFPIALSPDGTMGHLTDEDVETLIEVRNLFAFLIGQPLVATPTHPNYFSIFLSVASMLKKFEFSNIDGSNFGEAAVLSFGNYVDELRLADVTQSREKTVEALILGENMRSTELYNEAFAHAVGKYEAIQRMQSINFDKLSPNTRNRLERSYMDLCNRERSASVRLTEFDFPSLFAGFASSTTTDESKIIKFKEWRNYFQEFRKFTLSHYKTAYGSWPPKASSKRNSFVEGGLNRLVLQTLYSDFASLYDYLVDRTAPTTRGMEEDGSSEGVDPIHAALRKLLVEYDRSSPPVQPPIPFDVPLVPTMATLEPKYHLGSPRDKHRASTRRLKDYEITLLLTKASNLDSNNKSPFLQAFQEWEAKESKGKNCAELADQRFGIWLFVYAVIQSLPMLVVDAPGLRFTQGVEYFLCEVPRSTPPWVEDNAGGAVKMAWYGVAGGQHIVSLPADMVDHGVEGIYRRSHCWIEAEKWLANLSSLDEHHQYTLPDDPNLNSPLPPPPGFGGFSPNRPNSQASSRGSNGTGRPGSSHSYRSQANGSPVGNMSRSRPESMAGLERLPMPQGFDDLGRPRSGSRGVSPVPHQRPASRRGTPSQSGAGSTFDDILGDLGKDSNEKRGRDKKKGKKSSMG